MTSQFNVCLSDSYEVFAVIFDDSVYLHAFPEDHGWVTIQKIYDELP